jgi:hypothetical protein
MTGTAIADAARKAFQTPFGGILELRPENGAPVFVDGRKAPPVVADAAPAPADCVWRCAPDIMGRVLSSKRAIENAVINGRLVIAGDMSVMKRLKLSGG